MKQPVGVILAGGLARRMGGGDKGLHDLAGMPVLSHVIERIAPQVAALALNANGDPKRFAEFGLPVLPDPLPDHPGPLAGLLAGLDWAAGRGAETLVTVPSDTPFLPCDLVPRLLLAAEGAASGVAIAATDGPEGPRPHPVCGLWPVGLRAPLRVWLAEGKARVGQWAEERAAAEAVFPAEEPDPFFNLNTPEDLAQARRLLEAGRE
ncbi:MAG: molybdenum cofactor guanylyltransferase MobA [Paracoccaceae bacterium]